MIRHLDAAIAVQSARLAAEHYGHVATDRDPDDGEHVVPGELRRFLGRLRLLHGVPFSYLVPDAKLLPVESVRFFHLDRAWTDALVQGALSVGTVTSLDRTQLEAAYPHIRAEVDEAERGVRPTDSGELLKDAGGSITGFVLRSRAVSGWPNLHVRAYREDVLPDNALSTVAESHPARLKVLRLERLAPAVLLALFDGVPAVVHIEEPRQGLQFGVRLNAADPPAARSARVPLRDNATGRPVGAPSAPLTDANSVPVPFRGGAPGVLDLTRLRQRLAAQAPNSGGALEANEFALQMLRFPWRQVFGDPDNAEQQQFYDVDRFQVAVSIAQWQQTMQNHLAPTRTAAPGAPREVSKPRRPRSAKAPAGRKEPR